MIYVARQEFSTNILGIKWLPLGFHNGDYFVLLYARNHQR